MSNIVNEILSHYSSDNPGVKSNLYKMLMHGKLSGTGKMVILPVDQGFEHGPSRSFSQNEAAYDPEYHFQLAIEAGLNAFAAPLGMLEIGASKFAGQIPLILKINSSNSLNPSQMPSDQAITASVDDALRLGCSAVGFTIYPGSESFFEMAEEISEIAAYAKDCGLAVVIWSYARGPEISKEGETAIDVCAYAAHMAALLGAHIIKVKPPTNYVEQKEAKNSYNSKNMDKLSDRISHINQSCFAGKRLVIFSGGASTNSEEIYDVVKAISEAGGNGSIIGRNSFQRPKKEALELLNNIIDIYKGE